MYCTCGCSSPVGHGVCIHVGVPCQLIAGLVLLVVGPPQLIAGKGVCMYM